MPTGLGSLIAGRRQELGLTRRELARRLGVPPAHVLELERSRRRWGTRLLPALAEVLDLPQLELAIAAGVITDLPPVPHAPPQLGPPRLIDTVEHQRLAALANTLGADEAAFLLAVAASVLGADRRPASPPG